MTIKNLFLILLLLTGLGACGQKGPLILPDSSQKSSVAAIHQLANI